MILPIVAYGDPVLKKEAEEISADYPGLKQLISDMYETMYSASGVGLAAPQIGKAIRLFIVDGTGFEEDEAGMKSFKQVFINPVVLQEEGEEWSFKEGCLSIPGVREDVFRKSRVLIEYQDEHFVFHEKWYDGMAARIAAPWIGAQQRRLPLLFPMVAEAEPRREAWHGAADGLAGELAAGETVVLLCEGDSSLYASCSYVLLALAQRHPACAVRVIPGISAVAAAAAAASSAGQPWPLALQQERLLIRPTPETRAEFEALLEQAAASGTVLALLKLGHRWSWVQPLLSERKLLEQTSSARPSP
jgi:precorrin-2/cobalt-factor-2 C20-methyltransferase